MFNASVPITAYLLMTSLLSFSVARPPSDKTGTGSKHHVTSTRSPSAQISRPTTADNCGSAVAADRPRDDGKLQTGSENRKPKCSEVDDADWSSGTGSAPSLSRGSERTGDGRPSRQRRSADKTNRKQYGEKRNRKENRFVLGNEVDDADWSLSEAGERGEGGTRQRRSADWIKRKYGERLARGARDLTAVGWNKRPRYHRGDSTNRDWRTNMMRVWGKRRGPPTSGSARMTSLF